VVSWFAYLPSWAPKSAGDSAANSTDGNQIDALNDQITSLQKKLDGMKQDSGGGGGSSPAKSTKDVFTEQIKLAALQTKVKSAADSLSAYAQTSVDKIGMNLNSIPDKFIQSQVKILQTAGISDKDIYNAFVKEYENVNPFESMSLGENNPARKFMEKAYEDLGSDPTALKNVGGYLNTFITNSQALINPISDAGRWNAFNFFESLSNATGLTAGSAELKKWKQRTAKLLNLSTVFDPETMTVDVRNPSRGMRERSYFDSSNGGRLFSIADPFEDRNLVKGLTEKGWSKIKRAIGQAAGI
jgi:hypothetical protein